MVHTKKRTPPFVLAILFLAVSSAFTCHAQTKFITTRGRDFIGPDGKPLFLRGINLGNWLLPEGYMFKFKRANSPRLIGGTINQLIGEDEARRFWKSYHDNYITDEDIRFIKQSGFNSVRVPFNYRLFVSEGEPQRLEGIGYELLDRVVGWCKKEGLFVILDMHAAPGGQTGDNIDDSWGYPFLFESAESQELMLRIWQKIAARYKNEPTIPLYRKVVAGIREVDRNHVIFLGGAQWDTNFKVFGSPFDKKLAYTFHKYWMEVKQEAIQEYVDFGDKYGVPVWMGESGENTDEWITSFRTLLERNRIGWCFWPYKKVDSTSCVASINKPADWDAIIVFADHPRASFEEVRNNRPPKEKINKALADFLEQIKFKNCKINQGYLKAIGLQ